MSAATAAAESLAGALASRLDFAALLGQQGRLMTLETALPALALIPERMTLREAVSEPYELVLDALSTSRYFELKRLVGEQMTLRLLGSDGAYHPWHGYVFEAAQLGADGGLARYRLVMKPWLALLGLRRDSFVFQDRTALEIVEDVFRDHPQAQYELQVTQRLRRRALCVQYRETDLAFVQRLLAEEGLSYHFRQLEGSAAEAADEERRARHCLVVTDREAPRPELGEARFTGRHETARRSGQRDAVTAFAPRRRVAAAAVTLGAWDERQLAGSAASVASALDLGALPRLEHYDGAGERRYEDAEHAELAAELALQAIELGTAQFDGQGSGRHFSAGSRFSLVDHPLYGGAADDNAFVLLAVEHEAANNLGAGIAALLANTMLERGSYANRFVAAPAAAPLVPRFVRKPTAPGLQTAVVVAASGQALTTDRDLRVKVQFPWQRGVWPLRGGLAHDGPDADGNAPGDDRSGTWVRIAQPSAGANWGSVFVPRAGTEVAVEFIEGDIDRPVIVGQLHNGQDLPPFSAGEDAGVNHPGVISGLRSQGIDGEGFNQWLVDDATGQLRMRLACSYTAAEVGLGHLIEQGEGAQRGPWRGAGFEAHTQGWLNLRAARGLLVTTSARPGRYGSAEGTQMDAAEALAQLGAARTLGQRLGAAAKAAGAHPLASHDEGQALAQAMGAIDPQQQGRHPGPVNGQSAMKPAADGRSEGSAPVEAFATPLVVLDTPAAQAWASEAGIASFAGQTTSIVGAGDVHQAAAHTYAQVSGRTTSLFTHAGGAKLVAANGPVSLRAHTDALQIWADADVTITSVHDEIRIQARTKIEVVGGQSSMLLDGGDVTFTCPGKFTVKGGTHAFLGGASAPASLVPLPCSTVYRERFQVKDRATGQIKANERYWLTANGQTVEGTTDEQGWTHTVYTDGPQSISLEIEQDSLELKA